MSIADDIIQGVMPAWDTYQRAGEGLNDYDVYGYTPLMETAICRQPQIAEALLARGGIELEKKDAAGRTALHWAVDNQDMTIVEALLAHKANPNAYTNAGMPALVYPLLREQQDLKNILYRFGARVDFALDYIYAKLLGHRFELSGYVDVINAKGEFIELDYEGFVLEFTVALMGDSLRRFTGSFATRHLREYFPRIYHLMDGINFAEVLLKIQHLPRIEAAERTRLAELVRQPMLVLPVASAGHAIGFLKYHNLLAKVDRGEHSLTEGSVNLYEISKPAVFDAHFLEKFLMKKQPRAFFHEAINAMLGLKRIAKIDIPSQIVGNCSWANMQALLPAALVLQALHENGDASQTLAKQLYSSWQEWDKDRALDESIQRFYQAEPARKASIAAMLAAVLFQACDYDQPTHIARAEKILPILDTVEYRYVLDSYIRIYCEQRLSYRGNNLLKILDDCGVDSRVQAHPVAHPARSKKSRK